MLSKKKIVIVLKVGNYTCPLLLSHSHTLLCQIRIGEILHTRPIAKGSRCDISAKSMSIGSLDLNLTYINHRNLITVGGTGLENYPISNRLF